MNRKRICIIKDVLKVIRRHVGGAPETHEIIARELKRRFPLLRMSVTEDAAKECGKAYARRKKEIERSEGR